MRLYRRLKFGSLMDMNVLDTRQYRSDQSCGGGVVTGCAAANDPARTILGAEQERWLFEQLPTVRAKWTVIAQQVPMFARDASGANPQAQYSMDKWDGYTANRDRVFARLKETKAPNPIVLSGDVHMHYGSDLKMDFRNPRSETIGVEFTNTSITSGSDGTDVVMFCGSGTGTVTSSAFVGNGGLGLSVASGDDVTIAVTKTLATHNAGVGVQVDGGRRTKW